MERKEDGDEHHHGRDCRNILWVQDHQEITPTNADNYMRIRGKNDLESKVIITCARCMANALGS
jgi:hypothetical protein